MRTMPVDIGAQYRRNTRRDRASVATARVRVTNRHPCGPSGSTAMVHTILTCPGAAKAAKSSGASGWKVTDWCQGWV